MDTDVLYIYEKMLLSYKNEHNNATCSDMDRPRDCHIDWSKSDKDKYHDIDCS